MPLNLKALALGIRIAQICLAVLVLSLGGYVAHWWRDYYHGLSPSAVNFLVFDAVWSILAIAYLVIVPWLLAGTVAHHPFATLAVETTTMIFWFAGFVALAVFLHGRICYGHVCTAVQAADVFAAFAWVSFAVTTGLAVVQLLREREASFVQSESKAGTGTRVHQRV